MESSLKKKRILKGKIVSDKMKDTIVVVVDRYVKHSKYKKYILRQKRYKVHDPGNRGKIGEVVTIEESRPISKDKHFIILENQ